MTGNAKRPVVTGMGLRGGVIVMLATAAEIQKVAGATTRVVDAHGQRLTLPANATIGATITLRAGDDGQLHLEVAAPDITGSPPQ